MENLFQIFLHVQDSFVGKLRQILGNSLNDFPPIVVVEFWVFETTHALDADPHMVARLWPIQSQWYQVTKYPPKQLMSKYFHLDYASHQSAYNQQRHRVRLKTFSILNFFEMILITFRLLYSRVIINLSTFFCFSFNLTDGHDVKKSEHTRN